MSMLRDDDEDYMEIRKEKKGIVLGLFLAVSAVILVLTRWVEPTRKLHPIIFILASAVVGVVFQF